ncbi:MAG: dipeptide/oligopeptide/nickel ABC transporter ATP-binding protein, partial [Methylobacterium sp.]
MSTPIGLATVPLARDRGGPAQPLLTVERLVKHFPVKKGLGGA